ncbi:hypothetical protein FACS1894142_8270 [Spirochaetia bacterium]|nr:hypothetical protein FACS1894142_8270 [Spirochaetia bacterium]
MQKLNHPVEKLVKTISYKDVEFDVVERPDVLWVGCIAYAKNNIDPPFPDDDMSLLERYRSLFDFPKLELINPDWSAAISINYDLSDKPSGIMFAQETYTDKQDKHHELFIQPGGLWLRLLNDKKAAILLGKEHPAAYEYYAESQIIQNVAKENGYIQNPNIHVCVEYSCHAEYDTPPHRNYAYMPICCK